MSAIGYIHRISNITDPSNSILVKKCINGVRSRGNSRGTDRKRLPIDQVSLSKLCIAAAQCLSNPITTLAFQTLCCVMFFGLFRVSELLGDKRLGIPYIAWKDLEIFEDRIIINLQSYKHSREAAKVILEKQLKRSICPIRKLNKLFTFSRSKDYAVFRSEKGKPITKNTFASMLRKCSLTAGFDKPFLSHCFRIGGATEAAKQGKSEIQIKSLGRWKSNAYNKYVRLNDSLQLSKTSFSTDSWPGGNRMRESRGHKVPRETSSGGGR